MGKNLIARIAAAGTQSLKFNNQVKNIDRWRRYSNSNAASVPVTDRVVRTRPSKLERQAMVESFVNKYREMNAGKFPTASIAVKQVGGSYYTVRKIIQELQYKSKLSSSDILKPTISFPGSHSDIDAKQSDVLKGDAEVSPLCFEKPADDKKEDAQHNDFDSVPSQGDHSGFAATENHPLVGEIEEVLHPCLEKVEDYKQEQAVDHNLTNVDGLGSKAEQDQGSIELDKNVKDVSTRQKNDAEVPKKSSLWGNLKSLADGIINIWRKM